MCVVSPSAYGLLPYNTYCPSFAGARVNATYCSLVANAATLPFTSPGEKFFIDSENDRDLFNNITLRSFVVITDAATDAGVGGVIVDWQCDGFPDDPLLCEDSCLVMSNSDLSCDGDTTYCDSEIDNVTIHTCVDDADCYCNSNAIFYVLSVETDNDTFVWSRANFTSTIDTIFIASCHSAILGVPPVTVVSSIVSGPPAPPSEDHSNPTKGVYIRMNGTQLIVTTTGLFLQSIALRKEDWFYYKDFNTTEFVIDLPPTVYIKNGILYVSLYRDGISIIETTFPIVAEVVCRLHDCVFCRSAFTDWSCLPTSQQIGLISILFLLLLASVLILPGFLYMLSLIYSECLIPVSKVFLRLFRFNKMKIYKRIANVFRSKVSKIKSEFEEVEDENDIDMKKVSKKESNSFTDNITHSDDVAPKIRMGGRKLTKLSSFAIIGIISILITPSQSCEFGTSIVGSLTDCVKVDSTHDSCLVKTALLSTLAFPGSTNCYSLYDENHNLYADMTLEFVSQTDKVSLVKAYYTAEPNVKFVTHRPCYTQHGCNGQDCEDAQTDALRNPYDLFENDGNIIAYPGETFCRRTPGCAANLCWLCNKACLYSAYGVVPSNNVITVYELGQRTTQPSLKLTITSGAGLVKTITMSPTSNITTTAGVLLKIVGNLQGSISEFGTNKIISGNGYWWLGHTSEANVPVAGTIGQLQANTLSKLKSASSTAFVYAPSMVIRTQGSDKDTFRVIANPELAIPQFKKFPLTLNGVIWTSAETYLVGNNLNPGALVVNIEMPEGISITRTRAIVCPEISKVSESTGCGSCVIGASFSMLVYSSCQSGVVSISSPDLFIQIFTVSTLLSPDSQNITVNFASSKFTGTFKVCLNSETNEKCADVVLNLIEDDTVSERKLGNTTENHTSSGGSESSSWTDFFTKDIPNFFTKTIPKFFDDIIKGLASWWEYLIIAVIAVIVILLILSKTPLFRKIREYRTSKQKLP